MIPLKLLSTMNSKIKNLDVLETRAKAKSLYIEADSKYLLKNYEETLKLLSLSQYLYKILHDTDPEKGSLGFYKEMLKKIDFKIATCKSDKEQQIILSQSSGSFKSNEDLSSSFKKSGSNNIQLFNSYIQDTDLTLETEPYLRSKELEVHSFSLTNFNNNYRKSNSEVESKMNKLIINSDCRNLEDYIRGATENFIAGIKMEFEFNWFSAYQYFNDAASNFFIILEMIDDQSFKKEFYLEKRDECYRKADNMKKKLSTK